MTDQAKMEKMIRTMMIALPSGVAVIQIRHNSDSAKKQYGTCMRTSPTRQAGRWNCANSGSPNGQNVFGFLESSEPAAFKQSKFFPAGIIFRGTGFSSCIVYYVSVFASWVAAPSGAGAPHFKTLPRITMAPRKFREVLECGTPVPLSSGQ